MYWYLTATKKLIKKTAGHIILIHQCLCYFQKVSFFSILHQTKVIIYLCMYSYLLFHHLLFDKPLDNCSILKEMNELDPLFILLDTRNKFIVTSLCTGWKSFAEFIPPMSKCRGNVKDRWGGGGKCYTSSRLAKEASQDAEEILLWVSEKRLGLCNSTSWHWQVSVYLDIYIIMVLLNMNNKSNVMNSFLFLCPLFTGMQLMLMQYSVLER